MHPVVVTPMTITIDAYPGWETSISPYRVTRNGVTYSPMSKAEVQKELASIVDYFLED